MSEIKATVEQQAIIDAYVEGHNILVQACAGSGKTSTICMAAYATERSGLYLAFNKAIAEEIKGKLPDHIESRTTHSLAYRAVGNKYRHKLARPKGRYINVAATPAEIVRFFKFKGYMDVSDIEVAKLAKLTVNKYESSAEDSITENHIPNNALNEIVRRANKRGDTTVDTDVTGLKEYILVCAESLWKERIDVQSNVLAMHDTYLKLFQLSKPNLDVDVVFLDECQDITPCVYDIVKQQEGVSQIVAVGDAHQAIYQWRGAVNAMSLFPYTEYTLSQSFRFGQSVADVANKVLEGLSVMDIKGNPDNHGVVDVIEEDNVTIISRTNTGVLMNALSYMDRGIPVDIKINVNDFCRILSEAQYLYQGDVQKVKHEELVGFQSWDELVEEAEEDGGLKRIANIVRKGKANSTIYALKNNTATDANIVCITAHKSKGLEWDNVRIDDDFLSLQTDNLSVMERNLIYVAVTRCMKTLELNNDVNDLFIGDESPRAEMAELANMQEEQRQMIHELETMTGEYYE